MKVILLQISIKSFLNNSQNLYQSNKLFIQMQIDRFNFPTHFQSICENLRKASFISFDCQFTGLVTNLEKIEGKFSDYQEAYERIKETALNFKILQFGLTAFIFNQEKSSYEAFSYNFYTLPFVNEPQFNNIMVAEVQSLTFLSQHGINWDRIFKSGIIPQRLIKPFQYERHRYDDFNQFNAKQYFFSEEDQQAIQYIEDTLQKISQKNLEQIVDFKKNSIYKEFLSKYMDKILLKKGKKTKKKFQFIVSFMGKINEQDNEIMFQKDQKPIKYVEKQAENEQIQQNTINPSIQALLKIVSDRKIPIVGHFPNLDLGLIYHTYFQPLPEKYEEFSEKITTLFPEIYDTKILSRRVASNFKGMKVNLGNLYKACQDQAYLKSYTNVIQCKESLQNDNRHEAGYDSYLTGYVFVGMANYTTKNQKADPVNFKQLQDLNGLIYSRETGEVSLRKPYTSLTEEYERKIVIWRQPKSNEKWRAIAQKLSVYGTLYVTEDHGETYFVFQVPNQFIDQIIKQFSKTEGLKYYKERKIPRARDIYSRCKQQLYYNDKIEK